ncbi:MAG: hypothetical protein ACW99F_04560 [Candidatus Hodarchaeales archaeon]
MGLTFVAIADIIVTSESSGMAYIASRLDQEPETYFVIEAPDSLFLKAIANLDKPVFLGLFGETEIDELIAVHNTSNIGYLDEFYIIRRLSVDRFSFGPNLLLAAIVGWLLLASYGITLFYGIRKQEKLKK